MIWILSDNSGYFIIAVNSGSSKLNIWKYLPSLQSPLLWYETSNLNGFPNSQMMFSDSQLFFISLENALPYNLHMCKVTFGNISVDWAKKIVWPTSSCDSYVGETVTSNDGSVMYTFFLYGDTAAMYVHFVSLNSSSGALVGTRYILSTTCTFIDSVVLIDNYLAVSMRCVVPIFIVFNLSTNSFSYMRYSSGDYLLGFVKDPNYSR